MAVNTRSAQPEVEFVLGDTGAEVDLPDDAPLPDGDPYVTTDLGPTDVAALFYTSHRRGRALLHIGNDRVLPQGSADHARGVRDQRREPDPLPRHTREAGPHSRTLISVPLFHVTGRNAQFIVAAHLGGTSVIMPTPDLSRLVAALAEERFPFLVTVPTAYFLLLRHPGFTGADVSGVRWLAYGGATVAPSLVRAVKETYPRSTVINGYGMTETASLFSVLPDRMPPSTRTTDRRRRCNRALPRRLADSKVPQYATVVTEARGAAA
ncbi:AMP-binding protein [Streptomyces albofaciens]|uniref:AMP-binding protein n=1 Tax=Streptomyces albofaciens TaxID=66866 RepID=UPI000A5D1287|nr:AMP-binding protein [Streptomyces albofaciens]